MIAIKVAKLVFLIHKEARVVTFSFLWKPFLPISNWCGYRNRKFQHSKEFLPFETQKASNVLIYPVANTLGTRKTNKSAST